MRFKNSIFFIAISTIFFSLYGCSVETPQINQEQNTTKDKLEINPIRKSPDNNDTIQDTNKTSNYILSAGDDQNILENSNFTLFMSIFDDDINITKVYWKIDDQIIAYEKNCTLKNLPVGTYTYTAFAEDNLKHIYSDSVNINVKQPSKLNHAPNAYDTTFAVIEDQSYKGALSGYDEDGDELDFLLVSFPQHGKLSGSAARLIYTPKKDFYGEDEFLYKINDGKIDSNIAKVHISVSPVNDAPISYEQNITIAEDSEDNKIFLQANDVDNIKLDFKIVNQPLHGTIELQDYILLYTPQKDYYGDDILSFTVSDKEKISNVSNIYLNIIDQNEKPTDINISNLYTNENSALNSIIGQFYTQDYDQANNHLYSFVGTNNDNRFFKISNDKLLLNFIPDFETPQDQDHNNIYLVNIESKDSDGLTISKEFNIIVENLNEAPYLSDISLTIDDNITNNTVIGRINGIDVDLNDTIIYTFISQNSIFSIDDNGYIKVIDANQIDYDKKDNYDFDIIATDSQGAFTQAHLKINISKVTKKLLGVEDYYTTKEDLEISFRPLSNDIDANNTLSISSITSPLNGEAAIIYENIITYSPLKDFYGDDTLTYTLTDKNGYYEEVAIHISVTPVNDQPIAKAKVSDTNISIGSTLTFMNDNSIDIDNDKLNFEWWEDTLLLSKDENFTKKNFSVGEHNITFIAKDGHGKEDKKILYINVYDKIISFNPINPYTYDLTYSSIVDIDNDRDKDILATLTNNTVIWFENHGKYNFEQHKLETFDLYELTTIKAYDVNNDNLLDIVYTSHQSGNIEILCINNGDKTFKCNSLIQDDSNDANDVAMDDIDNDGKIDNIIVLANGSLYWYKQLENGIFGEKNVIASDIANPKSIITEDFDKDGNIDIAVAANGTSSSLNMWQTNNCVDNATIVYKNNSNATSFTEYQVADTSCAISVSSADIDNDGYKDLITVANGSSEIFWHRNLYADNPNANPPFDDGIKIANNMKNIRNVSVIDMDHDGSLDIVSSSIDEDNDGKSTIKWFKNINKGSSWQQNIITENAKYAYRTFTGDLNNDNNYEIVSIGHVSDSNMTIYKNNYPIISPLLPKVTNNDFGEYNIYKKDVNSEIITNIRTGRKWADNNSMTSSEATYCENLDFEGFQDWRLPTIWESYYFANPFTKSSNINTTFNSISTDDTTYIKNDLNLSIDISSKSISQNTQSLSLCTRGDKRVFKYIRDDLNNNVIEATYDLSWDDSSTSISTVNNIEDANNFCIDKGMRVPNINELLSIYDNQTYHKLNKAFKTYKNDGIFWSSSLRNNDIIKFNFNIGETEVSNETISYIRCVKTLSQEDN